MKQVGDLTEFVRSHMLEPFAVEDRITKMPAHFADLTSAHEAVLKARDQIQRLAPIVADCDRHDETASDAERLQLSEGSDILQALQTQLETTNIDLVAAQQRVQKARETRAAWQERQLTLSEQREQAAEDLDAIAQSDREALFTALDELRGELLGAEPLTLKSCDARERNMRDQLAARIVAQDKRIQRLREKIVKVMSEYANAYPEETREVDASPESATEYREMLAALTSDGLPRFESRFKDLLNENAICEIASFSSQLRVEASQIKERVETINASMHRIDYNPGRYSMRRKLHSGGSARPPLPPSSVSRLTS